MVLYLAGTILEMPNEPNLNKIPLSVQVGLAGRERPQQACLPQTPYPPLPTPQGKEMGKIVLPSLPGVAKRPEYRDIPYRAREGQLP